MRSIVTGAVLLTAAVLTLSSCGNTLRGMGQDTANTINATQDAAKNVGKAARR
ncbi:entericidin [Allorhizobium borbori]|jgi:entericidin B|uniref:Entericidin B n=1 Tax=Allorhizobium borbori TaxID=485907 RepID=A0A7W6K1H7_9HYPH|nr:entericidin [Allorhizobium borbori]MBB4103436.1 entericidin B [Allorhizobium borbori]PZU23897.1 MAG: entericidin [Shinella sp.]